jgi:uncharacterized membrane protein
MGGYLKAGKNGDWESESRGPEIFSLPMMMQGPQSAARAPVRRAVAALEGGEIGDARFSICESSSRKYSGRALPADAAGHFMSDGLDKWY